MKPVVGLKCIFIVSIIGLFGCEKFDEEQDALQTRAVTFSSTDYYWYGSKKIPLLKSANKNFILFDASNISQIQRIKANAAVQSVDSSIFDYQVCGVSSPINLKKSIATNLKWTVVENIAATTFTTANLVYSAPFFMTENGNEIGLSNLFYVKLKNTSDIDKLEQLAAANHVDIIGQNKYMPLWYTLYCTSESTGNALDMANLFYETELFEASEPDFMMDKQMQINDPLFSYQWYLENTGQDGGTPGIDIDFPDVRAKTQGASDIIVAVVDHGIQFNHPDITNIYRLSYDSESDSSPSVLRGEHGTKCAGIIGATTNNGIGIAGIAPLCPLMSISNLLVLYPNSPQTLANAINFATNNGASVISNSWGHEDLNSSLIDDAIRHALTSGRNGKGCVVVFASGNDYQGIVAYPARSNPDIIAVGSISNVGMKSNFSQYGTALDVVAPGENIYSTTASNNYMSSSGTSFACPQVAAVAALILSRDPTLTQKQVSNIIESTAQKIGGYTYAKTSGRLNGTWCESLGYGLLNAFKAVYTAKESIYQFTNRIVDSESPRIVDCSIYTSNITVNNGATLTLRAAKKITISGKYKVESGGKLILTN